MEEGEGQSGEREEQKPTVKVISPITGLDAAPQVAPTGVSGTRSKVCAYHPSMPAVYICGQCSKSLCLQCAVPYGQLYLCPQCHIPPQITAFPENREPPVAKPTRESLLALFGGLLIIVGYFLPWVTSDYISPGDERDPSTIISGFVIMSDYPEVALVLTMGILVIIIEFVLVIVSTSPTSSSRPPIGVRLIPMFLGLIAYLVLAEVALRAESFITNIHMGWVLTVVAASLILLGGALQIWKHYKGEDV